MSLLSYKKQRAFEKQNLDEPPGNFAKWKQIQAPKVTYHVIACIQYTWKDKTHRNGEQISVFQGSQMRFGGGSWMWLCGYKKAIRISGLMEMFCIWTVSLSTSQLPYSFARCYSWGEMDKRYQGSLWIIYHECMGSTTDRKIKMLKWMK